MISFYRGRFLRFLLKIVDPRRVFEALGSKAISEVDL